jgi:hypothetical protein
LQKKTRVTGTAKKRSAAERMLTEQVDALSLALQWQPVFLVTLVEAYLHDVLAGAASVDRQLMGDSDQRASYEEVLGADSLESLQAELRNRWARNWIERGGPSMWIKRLERMGAPGFEATMAQDMEFLWGARHVMVHNAGIVTRDFIRHHPDVPAILGDPLRIEVTRLPRCYDVVDGFVANTDRYFIARYPQLAVRPPNLRLDADGRSDRQRPRAEWVSSYR